MVYSSMSPQLFEHTAKIPSLTLPPSLTKQTPSTLPKLEYLHLVDSTPLAHSLKKQGGTPPSFPFRNSRIFFQSATTITIDSTGTIDMECGAPAPLFTKWAAPLNRESLRATSNSRGSRPRAKFASCVPRSSLPFHDPFTNVARSCRDSSDSSLTSLNLLRIYQC
jgi:hypothetical protein